VKRYFFCCAAATALFLAGCGGGGGGSEPSDITREAVIGNWAMRSIRANANYEGSGTDTPCPATLKHKTKPSLSFRCGQQDAVVIRSDGTATYLGASATWSLNSSVVTLDLGRTLGVITIDVSREPDGNRRQLRLRLVSRVVNGVRNTDEDGSEIVINDLTT
jgi:hypothetical protein